MRQVPAAMTAIWKSGVFTGPNRPVARVTIQQTQIQVRNYLLERYSIYNFGNPREVVELPNVKSVKWSRSIDSDAGTCDIEIYNTAELPIGVAPDTDDYVYNQPGFYTPTRGADTNRWNHQPNHFSGRLFPGQLVRTFEGYGYDKSVGPEVDPHMMQSGVWIIDDVILGADATITLKCRDAARLAMDQIAFPPVVSEGLYPLKFEHFVTIPDPPVPSGGGANAKWINPPFNSSSSVPYGGANIDIHGHRASDAYDGSDSTWWLSIGNSSPSADFAYEWIQSKFTTLRTVSAVRVFVKGGPYRVYVSLHTTDNGGHWVGSAKIPYDPNDDASSPNGANIRYVKHVKVHADKDSTINVKNVANVDLVRLTFHHLWDSGIGTYPYRAAVRDVDVLVDTNGTETWASVSSHIEGNYADWSDITKWLLGYAGFLWPTAAALAYQQTTAGRITMVPPNPDPVLWGLNADDYVTKVIDQGREQIGEIWGDIEQSGTFGPSDLTSDIFDKKPLWDGLAYVRDILGFGLWIDETGAAVFRSPNIWRLGNNLSTPGYRLTTFATHVNDPVTGFVHIDESQTLMGLQATLSDRNTRELIIVANITGDKGAVVNGFSPTGLPPAGMRRVAIWSDEHFLTTKECRIMADLIAIRQLFTFRTDSITIPGYPAIQIDDQIKLTEGVTEEMDDVHYVKGITSTLDMSSGDWDYQLDTHWLGTEPFGKWAFDPANLSADTQEYLTALGKI